MTFNTEITGLYWQEDAGQWKVTIRQTAPGKEPVEFEDTCDLLLYASGVSCTESFGELSNPT